jgi:hypothetical protein
MRHPTISGFSYDRRTQRHYRPLTFWEAVDEWDFSSYRRKIEYGVTVSFLVEGDDIPYFNLNDIVMDENLLSWRVIEVGSTFGKKVNYKLVGKGLFSKLPWHFKNLELIPSVGGEEERNN